MNSHHAHYSRLTSGGGHRPSSGGAGWLGSMRERGVSPATVVGVMLVLWTAALVLWHAGVPADTLWHHHHGGPAHPAAAAAVRSAAGGSGSGSGTGSGSESTTIAIKVQRDGAGGAAGTVTLTTSSGRRAATKLALSKDAAAAGAGDAAGASDAAGTDSSSSSSSASSSASSKQKGEPTMFIATGANSAYFSGLTNLVGSVRYWCPDCHVLVFNLGLADDQMATVRGWCNTTLLWPNGIHGAGHDQEHLGAAKKYAWKPLAIKEAVDKYEHVVWLDAGSTVTTHLKTTVWPLLLEEGNFLVQGQDLDMVPWCSDLTWKYFNLDKEKFRGKPSFSGNTVGFVRGSPGYHKILIPWTQCAVVNDCISPPGTSTANHRFDQSVLSIISYTCGLDVKEHTELLLASGVPCYKPHERAVWTSRQGESCYARYALGCDKAAALPPLGPQGRATR